MAPSPLKLQLITFNCGRSLVDVPAFSSSLFQPYHDHKSSPNSSGLGTSNFLPDLLVLNLQEVAPVAFSFLGASYLTPYFSQIVKSVQQAGAQHNREYELVIARNVGMTAIVVLANPEIKARLKSPQVAGVGVGDYGLGNKGAVGVRIELNASTNDENSRRILTFVSAHLAPTEDAVSRRNQDWESIVRGLAFHSEEPIPNQSSKETQPLLSNDGDEYNAAASNEPSGMFYLDSPVFFAGDLNYRTNDTGPAPKEHMSFIQPSDFKPGSNELMPHASKIRSQDQLDRERKAGRALHLLSEAAITFPPTYKYSEKAQKTWPRNGEEPSVYHWSSHRFPSWCDRILYSTTLANEKGTNSPLTVVSYTALPLQPTSDHRPVTMMMQLDLDSPWWAETHSQKAPFPLKKTWREDRIAERRKEILVGLVALITTTTEGLSIIVALMAGTVGGWYLIKAAVAP